jgi:hypothetical protein
LTLAHVSGSLDWPINTRNFASISFSTSEYDAEDQVEAYGLELEPARQIKDEIFVNVTVEVNILWLHNLHQSKSLSEISGSLSLPEKKGQLPKRRQRIN